jgi:O-acetyl-ADP-ribose deacetylase (regulator of RNase III)
MKEMMAVSTLLQGFEDPALVQRRRTPKRQNSALQCSPSAPLKASPGTTATRSGRSVKRGRTTFTPEKNNFNTAGGPCKSLFEMCKEKVKQLEAEKSSSKIEVPSYGMSKLCLEPKKRNVDLQLVGGDIIEHAINHSSKNLGVPSIVIHCCNSRGAYGAGIAKQIRNRFPEAYKSYLDSKKELGTISWTLVESGLSRLIIVNCVGQDNYGSSGRKYVSYTALRECLKQVRKLFFQQKKGCRVFTPQIGCGLGGGDWKMVATILNEEICDHEIPLTISRGFY